MLWLVPTDVIELYFLSIFLTGYEINQYSQWQKQNELQKGLHIFEVAFIMFTSMSTKILRFLIQVWELSWNESRRSFMPGIEKNRYNKLDITILIQLIQFTYIVLKFNCVKNKRANKLWGKNSMCFNTWPQMPINYLPRFPSTVTDFVAFRLSYKEKRLFVFLPLHSLGRSE